MFFSRIWYTIIEVSIIDRKGGVILIRRKKISRSTTKLATPVAILSFILMILVCSLILQSYALRIKKDNENKAAVSYYSLNDEIKNFSNHNTSILSGFSAFISSKENYTDEEIVQYLHHLLKDHLDDIRNIGVAKDTTIQWVYPLKGNEAVIGTDLAKIPKQAEEVSRVKHKLETLFVGPVDLVQGGRAFIVRMPLIKDENYWGMVSIVLNAENAFKYVDQHADIFDMEYLITTAEEKEETIYGNPALRNKAPLKFRTDETLGGWNVYVVPQGGWNNQTELLVLGFFISVLLCMFIATQIHHWMMDYSKVLTDKIELERKYIQDRFTGIYTREYFNFRLKEELSNAHRNQHPISMIYFDLDYFKRVNDEHGHSTGDEVLLNVVEKVKSVIREADVFSRWGGDEFILLLPYTDYVGAGILAERVRQEIETSSINQAYGVTASLGYSEWKPNEYHESWFHRTDNALYTSKNSGRNKTTGSDPNQSNDVLVKVEWNPSSNSGCSVIDLEHKSILDRCNQIVESALEQSAFDETIRNVEHLIIELEQHFLDEIEILREANYPEIDNHQRIHDALLKKTNEIFQKTIRRDITAIEFFKFLVLTVIEGHFQYEDTKYFKYLKR